MAIDIAIGVTVGVLVVGLAVLIVVGESELLDLKSGPAVGDTDVHFLRLPLAEDEPKNSSIR